MEKYINSIDELNLGSKVCSGSCSEIYEMKSGVYFKKFCEDYSDLSDPINLEFFKTIKTISDIEKLPYIVKALDIYRSDTDLFGYSMNVVDGVSLDKVSDQVLILQMLNGFDKLKEGIRNLSDSFVKTEDIGGDNILFNGNLYLLDLDLSLVDNNYVPDELYYETRSRVFKNIFQRMTGLNYNPKVLNDDYFEYMKKYVDFCSNYVNEDIKSIGELRDVSQKIYKKTIK